MDTSLMAKFKSNNETPDGDSAEHQQTHPQTGKWICGGRMERGGVGRGVGGGDGGRGGVFHLYILLPTVCHKISFILVILV